jgi:septum formation protein
MSTREPRGRERPRDLVLASTSPYRRALLSRLGVPFRCVPPRFDESSLDRGQRSPRALAEALALGKAASIAAFEPEATIIGCDQLVALEGQILGKPGTAARAVEQLTAMSGRVHELITAVVVLQGERRHGHTDVTVMKMRPLDRDEIDRYVDRDQPLDCAGSYKVEETGIALFETIATEDHTAITGLPLIRLTTILHSFGFAIP